MIAIGIFAAFLILLVSNAVDLIDNLKTSANAAAQDFGKSSASLISAAHNSMSSITTATENIVAEYMPTVLESASTTVNNVQNTLASASDLLVLTGNAVLETTKSAVNEIDWNVHLETLFATMTTAKSLTTDAMNAMSGITWTEAKERAQSNMQEVEEKLKSGANFSITYFLEQQENISVSATQLIENFELALASRPESDRKLIRSVLVGGVYGAGATALAGAAVAMLVPSAMAAFGTVVAGVGTMHAVGGVAATLQATAAVLSAPTAILTGAAAGSIYEAVDKINVNHHD
jgi:hypothetical protein